jgi:molybdopterin-guanine dinucleotide biosynthesis protein A
MLDHSCLGVILAGGASSRMGREKALLSRLNSDANAPDETMLSFSKGLLQSLAINTIVISGEKFGIKDKVPHMGPLGGIYSVIKRHPAKALLITPVDLPLLTVSALAQLKKIGELSNKACFYQNHFLPLYLPMNAFVEQFFAEHFAHLASTDSANRPSNLKAPSMRALLSCIPSHAIACPTDKSLHNANTPEQWRYAQLQLTGIKRKYV